MSTDLVPRTSSDYRRQGARLRDARAVGVKVILIPFAWALAAFDVFVLLWILLSSFKTTRELIFDPWGLPAAPQWENYVAAWTSANLGAGILNSVVLVVSCSVASVLLGTPAAYALARFRRPSSGPITILFVLGLGVPVQAIFIPLFVAFDRVGLIDSILGLFLIYTGLSLPFTVFLLTGFFRSLPRDLEEAAALDGLRPGATFWRIMFPLARSGLITVTVLQAIGFWGETFFAMVFLRQESTISVALMQFMKTMQYTGARWEVLFAGIALIILPLLLLYIWLGSRLIDGIAAGYSR